MTNGDYDPIGHTQRYPNDPKRVRVMSGLTVFAVIAVVLIVLTVLYKDC